MNSAKKHTQHEAMHLRKFSLRLRIDGDHINTTQPENAISTQNAKNYRQRNTALFIIRDFDEDNPPIVCYQYSTIKFPNWQVRVSKFIAELYARGIILDLVNWSIYGKTWFDKERTYNPPARMLYAWIDVPLPMNLRGIDFNHPEQW